MILSVATAAFGAIPTFVLSIAQLRQANLFSRCLCDHRDFYVDTVLAGMADLIALAPAERSVRPRQSPPSRTLASFAAALISCTLRRLRRKCSAPPGRRAKRLASWSCPIRRIILPIALTGTALRCGVRRVFSLVICLRW